jgi:hypothetical protein
MSDFKTRLLEERNQLSDRVEKLDGFLNSENSSKIDKKQKTLLGIQLPAMQAYLAVLDERISLLD